MVVLGTWQINALVPGWQGATPLWAALGPSPPSKTVCVVYLCVSGVAQWHRPVAPAHWFPCLIVWYLTESTFSGVDKLLFIRLLLESRPQPVTSREQDQRQRGLLCACAFSSLQGKGLVSFSSLVVLVRTTSLVPRPVHGARGRIHVLTFSPALQTTNGPIMVTSSALSKHSTLPAVPWWTWTCTWCSAVWCSAVMWWTRARLSTLFQVRGSYTR